MKNITHKLIERLYVQEKKSVKEIGCIIKKSPARVSQYLKLFGISARPFSTKGLQPRLGAVLSEETKEKIRQKHLGKKLSSEHKAKVIKTLQYGQKRELNPMWKGGRIITDEGYIKIKLREHPRCDKQGYILEHRYILEQHLGRYLLSQEVVHHLNGNKQDNRVENLIITISSIHSQIHHGTKEARKKKSIMMKQLRKNRFWSTKRSVNIT